MDNKIVFEVAGQKGNKESFGEIEKKIDSYKNILNIKDWDIKLNFLTSSEMADLMGDKGYIGCCQQHHITKSATICLNIEHTEINEEVENTIIHEMVHIQVGNLERLAVDLCQWSPNKDYFKDCVSFELEKIVSSITKSYESLIIPIKEGETNG